jgi:hypothetical protein
MDVTWASDWIEDYADAWRRRDPDALAELFTEDAVYASSPLRAPTVGREAIRAYWREPAGAPEQSETRFGNPVVHGNRVVVEWWSVKRNGDEESTLAGCLLLRFASGGRCAELHEYWDQQQGRLDPPEGWGH